LAGGAKVRLYLSACLFFKSRGDLRKDRRQIGSGGDNDFLPLAIAAKAADNHN